MKRRTIPQVELRPLSGVCTPLFVDSYTLQVIRQLWTTTQYPATFTLNGKERNELETGFEIVEHNALIDALLEDFERGYLMSCDFAGKLDGIINAIANLKLQSSSCCTGGNGGNNNSGIGDTDPISPPETPQESTSLCTGVRFVQHVAQSWVERYLAPLAGLNAEQITLAVLASFALPPYGDELPAIAVGVVAAMVGVGVAAFVLWLGDLMPAIADELYCRLVASDYPDEGVAGWLADVIADVIASEAGAGAGVADWIVQKVFNVSGATAKLIDLCAGQMDNIADFPNEPCTCDVYGSARLLTSGENHDCGLDMSSVCPDVTGVWCQVGLAGSGSNLFGVTCTYDKYLLKNQPANATHVRITIPWACYSDGGIIIAQGETLTTSMATGYSNYNCGYAIECDITPGVPVLLYVYSSGGWGGNPMVYCIDSVVWS